jgi:hypothetical protein
LRMRFRGRRCFRGFAPYRATRQRVLGSPRHLGLGGGDQHADAGADLGRTRGHRARVDADWIITLDTLDTLDTLGTLGGVVVPVVVAETNAAALTTGVVNLVFGPAIGNLIGAAARNATSPPLRRAPNRRVRDLGSGRCAPY